MNSKVNFFFGVFTSFLMLLCWNIFEIEQTGLANLQIDKKNVNDILYKEVRVLCWIMTSPTNLKKKAMHVKNTWLPRCNKYLFMSSPDNDTVLETIQLNVTEGRHQLWAKTQEAFRYIYEHHLDDADWFMKADDDTYVIMENLRYVLSQYSSDMPIYFGQMLSAGGYMAGGAGYILSKESVIRYVEKGLRERVCDRTDTEDAAIGDCLHKLQVISGDVRDASLRERFFQFRLETALQPTPTDWWVEAYVWYKIRYGLTTCCSDLLVTAHKIIPEEMYLFEYLIYKVKVFGKQYDMSHELPTKMALKKVLSYVDKQNWVMNRWSNKSGT